MKMKPTKNWKLENFNLSFLVKKNTFVTWWLFKLLQTSRSSNLFVCFVCPIWSDLICSYFNPFLSWKKRKKKKILLVYPFFSFLFIFSLVDCYSFQSKNSIVFFFTKYVSIFFFLFFVGYCISFFYLYNIYWLWL